MYLTKKVGNHYIVYFSISLIASVAKWISAPKECTPPLTHTQERTIYKSVPCARIMFGRVESGRIIFKVASYKVFAPILLHVHLTVII